MKWQDDTPPDAVRRGRKRLIGAVTAAVLAALVALDLLPAAVAEPLRHVVDGML